MSTTKASPKSQLCLDDLEIGVIGFMIVMSNTKYSGGYIKGSRTIKLFWEVLREFEPKEHCVLMKFEDNQDKVSYVLAQAGVKLQRLKAQLESVVVSFHYHSSTTYDERKLWILGSGPQCCVPKELALHKYTSSNLEKIGCYHDRHDILEALYASNLTYAPVAAQVPYRWHDSVNALDNT
nr:E3 ubiquitin-protein ligase UPL7 [Tanacetum cinerariifolium]